MKPKTPKRFTSEKEILDAIEQCHVMSKNLRVEVERRDESWKRYQATNDASLLDGEQPQEYLDHTEKLLTKALNLVNKKAKKLGEKLSEFRTMLLPTIEGDNSVPRR